MIPFIVYSACGPYRSRSGGILFAKDRRNFACTFTFLNVDSLACAFMCLLKRHKCHHHLRRTAAPHSHPFHCLQFRNVRAAASARICGCHRWLTQAPAHKDKQKTISLFNISETQQFKTIFHRHCCGGGWCRTQRPLSRCGAECCAERQLCFRNICRG